MAARGGTGSKLKRWQHPPKSGIWVCEVLNRSGGQIFGASYKVTLPAALAGVRKRKQFAEKEDAEKFATDEFAALRKHGQEYLPITPAQHREVAAALDLLGQSELGLLEAVQFAVKHMRPEGGDRTVQQVVDQLVEMKRAWLDTKEIREHSFRDFKHRAAKFAEGFGTALVKDVSLEEIKAWLKALGLSSRSTKNYRMVVSEIMKFSMQKKFRADNPMLGFTRADKRELEPAGDGGREPGILTVSEAEKLLQTAFAHPAMDLGAAVVLALFCGIRTEELKRLDWSAVRIDDPQPFVKIDRSIAKKRRIRNVEIPACAIAWLRAWPNKSGKLARNAYITDYVKRFAKLTKLAGFGHTDEDGAWVSTWDDNCMRHSFGSYWYALTGDSLRTASLLGHKANDQVLFDHYRALTTKAEAEMYFAIVPKVEEQAAPPSQVDMVSRPNIP